MNVSDGEFTQVVTVVSQCVGVCGIFMNLCVVISSGLILNTRLKPRITYMLLGNIALGDFCLSIGIIWHMQGLHVSKFVCDAQMGLLACSSFVSLYSILLIAIDRFCYIMHGMKYAILINIKRIRFAIATIWFFGILFSCIGVVTNPSPYTNGPCLFHNVTTDTYKIVYAIIRFIPFILTFVIYALILRTSMRHINKIKTRHVAHVFTLDDEITTTEKMRRAYRWKPVKVVLATTCVFLISVSCFLGALIAYLFTKSNIARDLCIYTSILVYLNPCANPLIYGWWHDGFRRFITGTLQKLCRANQSKP